MQTTITPPGPAPSLYGIPLLRQMRSDYLGTVRQLHSRYGDAVHARIGAEQVYEFFRPDWVREVLVEQARNFIRWERGTDIFAKVHGQSVLVTESDTWQRQRRMLQPGFGPKRMAGYGQHMVDAAAQALDALPPQSVQTLDFEHMVTQLTMDVVLRTLFSQRIEHHNRAESMAAEQAVRVISREGMEAFFWPFSLPDWMPHKWTGRRAKQMLDGLVRRHIQQRRQSDTADPNDLLSMLMAVRDDIDASGDGAALTDEEIRDQCMTIFLAGHETTAAALTWWGHTMARHPDCAQRAQNEVDQVLGQRLPAYTDLPRLPYLAQTLKETMRLYPPAPALISRRALHPVQIGPWQVPRGALVRVTPWLLQHDARWFPEPERFDPERFSDAGQAAQERGSYMPFGAGPRVCIGQLFASTEMSLIAAMVLQRFRLSPGSAAAPQPVLNVTLRPAGGMPLQLERR
jgi:cytochrome P450